MLPPQQDLATCFSHTGSATFAIPHILGGNKRKFAPHVICTLRWKFFVQGVYSVPLLSFVQGVHSVPLLSFVSSCCHFAVSSVSHVTHNRKKIRQIVVRKSNDSL
jgi:hypothetical protein